MPENIDLSEVYDKNLNFLIGAGASYGLLPTLSLNIKGSSDEWLSIESLAKIFEDNNQRESQALLFMHYYKKCVEPAIIFEIEQAKKEPSQKEVLNNYTSFLNTVLLILQKRKNDKRCNIFTTNYDGCFVHCADSLLKLGYLDFKINDGATGFRRRYIHAKNFNNYSYKAGVFDRYQQDIPQINLIHLHGSVYWIKEESNIRVDYEPARCKARRLSGAEFKNLNDFSKVLEDGSKTIDDLPVPGIDIGFNSADADSFWEKYNELPIVNPRKWKFHETVFEEHYYQMLRLLSYELEKPDSIFITFGFSFADEHILNLVKRSLSNPSLQLYICCFDESERKKMHEYFRENQNVKLIALGKNLDFSVFNKEVFTLNPPSAPATKASLP